jgi:transcriptional regulator GlxA family with amidase domain
MLADTEESLANPSPFKVEIIGESGPSVPLVSGMPIGTHHSIDDITSTDIIIVPSIVISGKNWETGRYPALVDWLVKMHDQGAMLCSACSGLFLLAETGLFDGKESTVHWGYAAKFKSCFPNVPVSPEKVLVTSGSRQQYVTSGAATSWHDLVLYLVSRFAGAATAQEAARFFALQWHRDGLTPYIVFDAPRGHGDALILDIQAWLTDHYSVAAPVEEMLKLSRMPDRTFKRRFTNATGLSPISYVQKLRVEEAKRQLERTNVAIDEISWRVGYEDPAFFRRLFKRMTGITPGAYRRHYKVPFS